VFGGRKVDLAHQNVLCEERVLAGASRGAGVGLGDRGAARRWRGCHRSTKPMSARSSARAQKLARSVSLRRRRRPEAGAVQLSA
jgi:hypothetical protein